MQLFEHILSLIAPHQCIICGREGATTCGACLATVVEPLPERCFMCKQLSTGGASCQRCKRSTTLPKQVWVASLYYKYAQELVERLKFARNKEAAKAIATIMCDHTPFLPKDIIITHVPTAPSRIRARGYDHAQLIAKQLAKQCNRQYMPLLQRTSNNRQVGASRAIRMKQLARSFRARPIDDSQKARPILIVDDVITTGGTLIAATKELRRLGCTTIVASAFAQKD